MRTLWKIWVHDRDGKLMADDTATTEVEAREQAAGWTSARGQLSWTAQILSPTGKRVATYRRGEEVRS